MIKKSPRGDSRTQKKLERWWDTISSYNIEINHISGDSDPMKLTDYCSRHPETKDITIANIKNFERAGVSLEQWQKATANDKSLLNGTGK